MVTVSVVVYLPNHWLYCKHFQETAEQCILPASASPWGLCPRGQQGSWRTPWAPGPAASIARGPASETFTLCAVALGLPRLGQGSHWGPTYRFLSTPARGRQDLSLQLTWTGLGNTEASLSNRTAVHQGRLHKCSPSGLSLNVISETVPEIAYSPTFRLGQVPLPLSYPLYSAQQTYLVLLQLPLLLKLILRFPLDVGWSYLNCFLQSSQCDQGHVLPLALVWSWGRWNAERLGDLPAHIAELVCRWALGLQASAPSPHCAQLGGSAFLLPFSPVGCRPPAVGWTGAIGHCAPAPRTEPIA